MPDLDPELLEAETVGVIYDEQDGFWFLPDYGLLAETFASPELAREKHHRGIVQQYVEDPDLPPLPLRRLAAHDPERATTVIRTVERRPDFEWQRDGEALLRRHKPSFYDRPPIPEVTPLSEPLIAAQARLAASLAEEIDAMLEEMAVTAKVGRNDPCPCGSDKKYKRCCGA